MKPRTKLEKRVVELSGKLPALTEVQKKWGMKHCFPHIAYRCKDEMWCSDCGKIWVDIAGKKEGTVCCPYCSEKLEVKVSRKKKDNATSYLTIVTTAGELQVLRHFFIAKYVRKDCDVHYFIDEVCQQWITEDRRETIIAKAMNTGHRGWLHGTDMSIKKDGNIYYPHSYDIGGYVYPKVRVLPILHRNGLRSSFHGITPAILIRALLGGSRYAEMLIKTRQYTMLEFYIYRGGLSHPWAVNICNRNGYIIKDGSMYHDYLHLLDYFHLDTHNAHYVCPKNLKKAHDELLERKRKKEAKERAEEERKARIARMKRMKEDILSFIRRMQPFFGIQIKDNDIVIRPLESVTQFYQEGKAMHHCVYQNEYYKRKDCLILTAQKDGKRLETVEVNLRTFKIIQSRAICNGTSKYHEKIIELVNRNMEVIRRAAS